MRRCLHVALSVALVLAGGCRTYSDKMEPVRHAIDEGDPETALEEMDALLDLSEPTQLPDEWDKAVPLWVLERATLQQALGEYRASGVNFGAADKELEMLDLSRDVQGNLAKYLVSASASKYRTTPTEKLFINSLNLVNYLVLGDLSGARVEVRRWQVIRDYLQNFTKAKTMGYSAAFGALLAGYTFERSNKPNEALRYYAEALQYAPLPFMAPHLAALADKTSYRTPELQAAMDAGAAVAVNPNDADVLLIAPIGRVPYREPRRVPVGLAVSLAAHYFTGDPGLIQGGLTKFVNYPELVYGPPGPTQARLFIDNQAKPLDLAANAALAVEREYDLLRPRIVAAALSRTLSRALISHGTGAAVDAAAKSSDSGNNGAGALGWLAGAIIEGSMVAADKPDTRSWTVLPGYFFVSRVSLPPGTHTLRLVLEPTQTHLEMTLELQAGEHRVVHMSAYQ